MRRKTRFFFGIAASLLCSSTLHAELTHRYTFDVDASDSVGTAHGTLEGNAMIQEGGVVLDPALFSYVNLPGGLIDGATAVSIESWASFGDNANWARLFDLGDTNPDSNVGRDYIFFTPHSAPLDARLGIADGDPGYENEQNAIAPGILDNQGVVHIVSVFDPENNSLRLYLNGELAGFRNGPTIPLNNISNIFSYIGRSLYTADPYLNGKVDEFRVYDHAVTAYEAAQSFAAGLDTYNPVTTPTPDAITLELSPDPFYPGNTQVPALTATYGAQVLNIAGEAGVAYASSDPDIISVTESGQLLANAVGTADITASFAGQESVLSLEVEPTPLPDAELRHRWSFNETGFDFMAVDSVGGADGTLAGLASFTGEGEVDLTYTANPSTDGYVDLPNGIISALNNATYEMWVTFDAVAGNWQRIFDFGNSDLGEGLQGAGTSYTFFSPRIGGDGPFRFEIKTPETSPNIVEGPTLPAGTESHVAITYNAQANISRVYVNGVLQAEGTAPIPLNSIDDVNNWIGRSQFAADAGFDGKFDEFRIYEGVLTDLEVMVSRAAGPETLVADPGALQGLSLTFSDELVVGGLTETFAVLADFAQIQDVEITTHPDVTITSSDTNIVTVTADGTITPVQEGTATITAQFGGQEGTAEVTVNPQTDAILQLLHRYSFNEAPGTLIAEDTVGGANGDVIGNATFTGDGQLSLPGGPASTVDAGYVNLPNGMISALPEAVTIESWVTWNGGPDWQRIWDFGNNVAGEDAQGNGITTFLLTPRAGGSGVVRTALRAAQDEDELPILDGEAPLPTGVETHVSVVYDYTSGVARMYVDGVHVATGEAVNPLSVLVDVNNWFGRSNWPDEYFNGLLNEIRIWSGAMSDSQVAARFAAGPDSLEEPTEGPELTVTEAEGTMTISWSASATGFELEQTTALGPDAVWTPVTEPVETEGGVSSVTITPSGEERFFRLAQ